MKNIITNVAMYLLEWLSLIDWTILWDNYEHVLNAIVIS